MKYVISLLISFSAVASPINLFYEKSAQHPEKYKQLLVEDYQIPEDLINMRITERCEEIRVGGRLDLCLKNNGDLLLVSVDQNFVNDSLKVFRAP